MSFSRVSSQAARVTANRIICNIVRSVNSTSGRSLGVPLTTVISVPSVYFPDDYAAFTSSRAMIRSFSSQTIVDKPLVPGIGLGKTSTGLVGLAVDHHAPQKIIDLNQALLDKLASSDMPETAAYRTTIEAIARYRIKVCEEHFDDHEKIEGLIECGQVEELVEQAKDEMEVLDMYLEHRMWERVKPNEVEIEYDPDPMKDHFADEVDDEPSK